MNDRAAEPGDAMPPDPHVFLSVWHPGDAPRALVFGRRVVVPIATCMLPVMIVTLFAVLEGYPILTGLLWASAGALVVALTWTAYVLRMKPAALRVYDGAVAIQSIWACAGAGSEPRPTPLFDVRDYGSWLLLTVAYRTIEIDRGDWEEYDAMHTALRQALP